MDQSEGQIDDLSGLHAQIQAQIENLRREVDDFNSQKSQIIETFDSSLHLVGIFRL